MQRSDEIDFVCVDSEPEPVISDTDAVVPALGAEPPQLRDVKQAHGLLDRLHRLPYSALDVLIFDPA
jgi:hypothetical protein